MRITTQRAELGTLIGGHYHGDGGRGHEYQLLATPDASTTTTATTSANKTSSYR